jgi:arylsulfatase
MKKNFLLSLALLTAFLALPSLSAAERPNIVLIIADDMGYSDLGCYGGEIETPNLNALADGGLRFTDYYVNNMCWPTRASLMTGLYPKTALPNKGSASGGLHPQSTTLPQALRDAGYTTLMSGKWHLSDSKQADGENAPHHRGFDHFYGTIEGASDFFAPVDLQLDGKDMTDEWRDNPNYYYTDAITDHALTFLLQAAEEKPFFLYLAYTAAHWPLHARPEDIAHYEGRYAMGWDQIREQRHARMKDLGVVDPAWPLSHRHPDVPAWRDAEHKAWQQRRMEVYAAQITSMDRNIGRVVRHLKQAEKFDNTIVLYQHDNGGCHVEYGEKRTGSWTREFTTDGKKQPIRPGNVPGLMPGPQTTFQSYGYGWANASNTPFRLFKQYDHEGGTRSPLIISWPEGIDPARRGKLVATVSHSIDLMPTLLSASGVELPVQKPIALEGRSLLGDIGGVGVAVSDADIARKQRPQPIFWAHNKGSAVRAGDWKLVREGKQAWELYDLSKDGTELNNLSVEMPEKVAELKALHDAWKQRTDPGHR